jgi:hypothetical protein
MSETRDYIFAVCSDPTFRVNMVIVEHRDRDSPWTVT